MTGPRHNEVHDLLRKREFSKGPWIVKIILMCMSFAGLSYYKYNFMKKNSESKRPQIIIPASRPSK